MQFDTTAAWLDHHQKLGFDFVTYLLTVVDNNKSPGDLARAFTLRWIRDGDARSVFVVASRAWMINIMLSQFVSAREWDKNKVIGEWLKAYPDLDSMADELYNKSSSKQGGDNG
jgi:hypothetical protein